MGLANVPCHNLQHHVGRRPSSSVSWENTATLPSSSENEREQGMMDLALSALAL